MLFFSEGNLEVTNSASGSKSNIKLTKYYNFVNLASQSCYQIKRRFTCIGQHE